MFKGKYLFLLFGFLLTMEMLGIPSVQAAYQLVWSDEFDGSSLNTSNWTYETGGGGWGNNELQYYTAGGNCTVSGGILTITAKKENLGGYAYTSTRIRTKGLREFKYGKIEARLAVPKGQGLWPAFWMLGANFPNTAWPQCGEIDIMEHINTDDTVYGTMHWDNGGYAMYGGSRLVSNMAAFHIYSIEWTPSYIRWFVDGIQFWEGNIANSINSTDEFHQPFFIILNLAIGGNWPGAPDAATVFPAQYQIDYVRVYQETAYRNIVDFDADRKTDITIWRPSNGYWYIIRSSDGNITYTQWGAPNDIPVPGDYDGDGKTDIAVYRASTGAWWIKPSGAGSIYGVGFGGDPSDLPVPGDYDGDGKTDIAIYRASTGAWWIKPSGAGSIYGVGFGGDPSDLPVPGDYDGDGKTDIAVYRASTGAWWIKPSGGGTV